MQKPLGHYTYTQAGQTSESGTLDNLAVSPNDKADGSVIADITVPTADSIGNNLAEFKSVANMQTALICTPRSATTGTQASCTVTCTNAGLPVCEVGNTSGFAL